MPRRKPAIDDETLRREVGNLADEVLLLPVQVMLICGLSEWQLKEHRRTKPPKPPHPEPREKPRDAPWYSLGECRGYRKWKQEQAAANAVMAKRKAERSFAGFVAWLNTANLQSEPWPFAITGPHRTPVDAWATIRGEVAMERTDPIEWLTLGEYLDARQKAALAEASSTDRAQAVAESDRRVKRAGYLETASNRARTKA
jgi:hypothetical protein